MGSLRSVLGGGKEDSSWGGEGGQRNERAVKRTEQLMRAGGRADRGQVSLADLDRVAAGAGQPLVDRGGLERGPLGVRPTLYPRHVTAGWRALGY